MVSSDENWKDISGYEGLYQVSDQGRVRGLPRVIQGGGSVPTKRLKGGILETHLTGDKTKYDAVRLSKNGVRTKVKVHQVVLETFVGPRPSEDHVARHRNDNPRQNQLTNLAWGTQSDNMKDKFQNGYVHHRKALTPEQEAAIVADPRSQRVIAAEYGINQATAGRIKQRGKF